MPRKDELESGDNDERPPGGVGSHPAAVPATDHTGFGPSEVLGERRRHIFSYPRLESDMIPLDVILDGDNCWPDLKERGFTEGEFTAVAALPQGTVQGRPTVAVRVELPDGTVVLAETTLALFLTAADAMKARHGDPRN